MSNISPLYNIFLSNPIKDSESKTDYYNRIHHIATSKGVSCKRTSVKDYYTKSFCIKNPDVENISESTTTGYEKLQMCSAINPSTGRYMNIEEYCAYWNLPVEDVKSYKLVSHTGTPYFNIVFQEHQINSTLTEDIIEQVIKKHISPVKIQIKSQHSQHDFVRAVITDVHIGMEPNPDMLSLFGGKWDREEVMNRADIFIQEVIKHSCTHLIIDDLGDLQDGKGAQTVRKGHDLPQNMSDNEMFELGVDFKLKIADGVAPYFDNVVFHNICDDNHSGSWGYATNHAFKIAAEIKYEHISVENQTRFIDHYYIGNHCFILCHGKDGSNLKFGFKPNIDDKGVNKIEQYIEENGISKDYFIEFSKGDSHQKIFDESSSDYFNYMNYPAFSPSSNWVQTNFKRGRSGFVVWLCKENDRDSQYIPKTFEWNRVTNTVTR